MEGIGGRANFAVDDIIVEGFAMGDSTANQVFAKVVDYACDFADLQHTVR